MIPILETTGLLLRPLELDDFADFFEYAQDPQVSTPGMWSPYESEAVAKQDFEHIVSLYEARNLMWWAIEDKETRKMIGRCELADYDVEDKKAELSYALHRQFWGRGYITEASHSIVYYGFHHLKVNRIGAQVFTDNLGSIRVLEKLGFIQEGRLRQYRYAHGQAKDVFIYGLLAEEWQI